MIPIYKPHLPPDVGVAIQNAIAGGQINHGPKVVEFENFLRRLIGNPWLTSTANVSATLEMCLRMAGAGPGTEVIASPMSCVASTMPVLMAGATMRWCDIDPATGTICPESARKHITPKTRVILVNHWVGHPADLEPLAALCREHGLALIDDVSEALGATYRGKQLGATGSDFSIFCFNPIRHLNCGEGSAVSFPSEAQLHRAEKLKRYGIDQSTFRDKLGEIRPDSDIPEASDHNFLSQIQAAFGLAQEPYLDLLLKRPKENGRIFLETIQEFSTIHPLNYPSDSEPAYWTFPIRAQRRDELLSWLRAREIYASKGHIRNDIYSCYGPPREELPGVTEFEREQLNLPCGWWVGEAESTIILNALKEWVQRESP
jgi:perosamine synthetase